MSRDDLKECGENTGQENRQVPCFIAHKPQAQMFDPRPEPLREQILLQICFGGRNYACFTIVLAGLERRKGAVRERFIMIGRLHLKSSNISAGNLEYQSPTFKCK
jgi:hypothetical protein